MKFFVAHRQYRDKMVYTLGISERCQQVFRPKAVYGSEV